ncbi:hypothetical protein AB0L06_40090 [Spirillospora sp. NPDC052269]
MGRIEILAAGAALLATTLTLAACGGEGGKGDGAKPKSTLDAATSSAPATPAGPDNSGKPPADLVKAALNGIEHAKSVRWKGDFTEDGQTFHVDLRLTDDAADGSMQVDGGVTKFRAKGGKLYLIADPATLEEDLGDKALAARLAGKWVLYPVGEFKEFRSFLSLQKFDREVIGQLRKVFSSVSAGGGPVRADVGGTPTLAITGSDHTTTMFVAANGTPRMLRFNSTVAFGGLPVGQFDFSEYDAPLKIDAPVDPIDIRKVGSGT